MVANAVFPVFIIFLKKDFSSSGNQLKLSNKVNGNAKTFGCNYYDAIILFPSRQQSFLKYWDICIINRDKCRNSYLKGRQSQYNKENSNQDIYVSAVRYDVEMPIPNGQFPAPSFSFQEAFKEKWERQKVMFLNTLSMYR